MARDNTGTKAVEDEIWRQLNIRLPAETGETLDRLKAVCNIPLVNLVKLSVDLFSLAHAAEQQGGRVIIVGADGQELQEVHLPHHDIRTRPVERLRDKTDTPTRAS